MPVPPLVGEVTRHHDGRYRCWTVAQIPWEDLPDFEPGMRRPVIVTLNGWDVHWYGSALYVYRLAGDGHDEEYHELHGTHYPDDYSAAQKACYDAGVMGLHVYENVAADYGLPSTLGWARHEPEVEATECGHDGRRVGGAQTAVWSRLLNPARDGSQDMWEGATDLFAVIAISTYGAADEHTNQARATHIEAEYGFVICEDRNDPGGTELHSWYTYEQLADATNITVGRLKVFLVDDIAATLKNAGVVRMHDVVWNNSAAVTDAEWARLGVNR